MDLTPLIQAADTKVLLVVMDGLGGYADGEHGTELEEATTPYLDHLAAEGTAGLDFELRPGDVAARGNLCTLAGDGTIADRRAGRLPDDEAAAVVAKLQA